MSNLDQNENLIDYLGGGKSDDSHTAEAIADLPYYAPSARLDPFAGSLCFTSNRFKVRQHGRIGWVIPVETAGIVRAFDGSHQIGVRCNVPGKMRDSRGKLVSRVVVAVGDLVASALARHRKPFAIPCAAGESQWAADSKSDRQLAKNDKRKAAASTEDAPADTAGFKPFGLGESLGLDDAGIETFRGSFLPSDRLGSQGIGELPEGTAGEITQWAEEKNAQAQAIMNN